ncbi:Uncharacterised protein [Burkholderia pseudomallei]|uniref:hypothetical protein n=1 Tax=Burkholderia pseudomallei TaxID=28450 RepID=UPI0005DBF44C|nr:hypothetical protein [Burkholderia pseudomallei]CFU00838.1 Uncharacterised protein [Burkholderia pseudomallei]CPI08924.1 Uncharacterised protein [Burkholderia pseudomallei]
MNNSAKRITVTLKGWQQYLLPGDLRRTDFDWLGTVQRGSGEAGALGRIKATGLLVQVNAGAVRSLDQRKAEAALAIALAAA